MNFHSRMRFATTMAFILLMSWLMVQNTVDGQISFSKDWGAGKRTPNNLHSGIKSATTMCHMLINNIKEMVSCGDDNDPGSNFGGRR